MKLSTEIMSANRDLERLVPFLDQVLCIIPYDEQLEKITFPIDYHIGVYPDSPQKDYDKPIIPLYPVNSFEDSEKETLQVLTAIKDNVPLSDVLPDKGSTALKDSQSLTSLFQERFPESLSNLEEIISDITYHFDKHLKLPRFNRDKEAVVELRERTYQGLRDKGIDSPVYRKRLEKELAIIHDMGFDDYFLIVWDLLAFGRQRGYYMGMGRGSAAGSLVAYA
ncbi:DNA polymerase III subunit alpha, partial [Streptococcus hyovaginalis]